MAINVSDGTAQESVVFDKLHIMRFLFEQRREENALYTWRSMANRYGYDSAGKRVYEPEIKTAKSDDFAREVADADYGGDMAAMLAAYTAAKASVQLQYQAGLLPTVQLMAAFEMCMAHAYKLSGINVGGIE